MGSNYKLDAQVSESGTCTNLKTTVRASAGSSVRVFTLLPSGESGSQARRGSFNLNHTFAQRFSIALPLPRPTLP